MNIKQLVLGVAAAMVSTMLGAGGLRSERWTVEEIQAVQQLSLSQLEPLPPDPTNRFGDDAKAVALGHRLFFDTRLSSNGKVSCASCHQAEKEFQDGTPLASGVGTTNRRTMPIAGTAYAPFLFWDGRKDSQWAQALGPLESAVEHGGTRARYARVIAEQYRREYEQVFGPLPDLTGVPLDAAPVVDTRSAAAWSALSDEQRVAVTQVYVNIGKAIAAYERRIQYGPSRVDRYIDGLAETGHSPKGILSEEEIAGLRLFAGRANCTQCHNGPLFSNGEFHNTGVPANAALPQDRGRANGAKDVLRDEFNCRSRWSDAAPAQCSELTFMTATGEQLERAYKVPSLRNVASRAPYMHAGQLATLSDVVAHYNSADAGPAGHTELKPLSLKPEEMRQLEAFLRALNGPLATAPELLRAPADAP